MAFSIRTYGDPVLKSKAAPVTDVDGKLIRLVDDMFDTLYESDLGIALAAPPIGCRSRCSCGSSTTAMACSSEIVESSASGCTTRVPVDPWLYVEMARPSRSCAGLGLDGEMIEIEADELEARLYQHDSTTARCVDVRPDDPRSAQGALAEYRRCRGHSRRSSRKRRLRLT